MSSFSSVVRKAANVAPRVAPRRNIVRKAPAPSSEDPAHVGLGLSANASLPSPPATGEDADTQSSLSTRESTISQAQQDAPETADQDPTTSRDPSRPAIVSYQSTTDASNYERVPAVDSADDSSTDRAPQANVHSTATAPSDEASSTPHGFHHSQPLSSSEDNGIGGQTQQILMSPSNSNGSIQAAQSVNERVPSGAQGPVVQSQPRPSRKRKQTPRASANVLLSQPSASTRPASPPTSHPAASGIQAAGRAASRTPSANSQRSNVQPTPTENEFDRISSRLQIVQDASAAINAHTLSANRSTRSATATSTSPTAADYSAEHTSTIRPSKRRRINRAQRRTAEEQAADVIANVMSGTRNSTEPGSKRTRGATPEDAEMHEITPETTKMGDLCNDHKWGKKSETEKEMAANWDEILRRRKEDAEERQALAAAGSRRKREKGQTTDVPTDAVVPEVAIENGQIVVTNRQIDRHAQTLANAQQTNEAEIREDKDIYKRVLATTVGCRNPQTQGQIWDELATELFYTGLKKFGTDFQMISATIPGKTRKQVKLKYNIEERKNWPRVKRCLSMKEEVNLDEYAEATGVQFASVADVYKQMEEDEKRLREEDEQRRRDEGIISQDQRGDTGADGDVSGEADVAIPSIETEAEAAAREVVEAAVGGGGGDRQSTASRVGSTTTARQTAQPSGRRKQTLKKNAATTKKGRQAAGKNKGFEGVEERIGGIEEVM